MPSYTQTPYLLEAVRVEYCDCTAPDPGILACEAPAVYRPRHPDHPSGDPTPSKENRECTERPSRAGKILGIGVLDHIILGHDEYFSFADLGLLADTDL